MLRGTLKNNCRLVQTKMGGRKKRIKVVLKVDAEVSCQMLKFLVFDLGFVERRGEVIVK